MNRMKFKLLFILLLMFSFSINNANCDNYDDYKIEAQSILNNNITDINNSLNSTEDDIKQTLDNEDITSAPKETKYANGNIDMETDARLLTSSDSTNSTEHQTSQLITNSYMGRPDIEVNSTDSFLRRAQTIENNATNSDYVINSVLSEYPDCQEQKNQTVVTTETKVCNEFIESDNTNCYIGTQIALNSKTKYSCSKIRETSNKTCTKTLKTKCLAYKECNTNGLILSSIASDMKWTYNYPDLTIGTIADNYWVGWCKTVDREIKFIINSLDMIEYMNLYQVGFDDYIRISINGHIIYIGPYGGNTLYTNGQGVFNGIDWRGCELATNWNISLANINIKPYLIQGQNVLKMRVIVAGAGEGWMKFKLRNKCCTTVSDEWEEICTE